MKKRWISRMTALLLCLALAAGVLPGKARAADDLTVTIDTGASVTLKDTDGNGYYEVGTADELYAFRAAVNGGNKKINIELTGNIVVNEGTLNDNSRAWIPAGVDVNTPFSGIIEGGNHTISGLYFNDSSKDNVGFLGHLGYGGKVQNLGIINSYFYGKYYVGALAGSAVSCSITNCYNTSTVKGITNVGGLVGYLSDIKGVQITRCYNTGSVYGYSSNTQGAVGGLVGYSAKGTTITSSYSTGRIENTSYRNSLAGALVGEHYGTIQNCYGTGTVYASKKEQYLVGYNYGSIVNCYQRQYSGYLGYKTAEQFASGEVAYLLAQGDAVWGQTIGKDADPVLGGAPVYYRYTTCAASQPNPVYTNDASASAEKPDHIPDADDGDCTTDISCSICGDIVTEGAESHTPGKDDGDCTTDILCSVCGMVTSEGAESHIPGEDDGDCTTDILCANCNMVAAEGAESHIPGEDDDDCTTDILCSVCNMVAVKGAESHTPGRDDGDCTTPIPCTQCEQMAVAGKTHNFEYGECANDGCNVRQTFTMTYYVDGVQVHQETYTCGSAYFLWTPEEKDGLTFLGWAETEGGEVKYPDWEYIWPAEDLTFHAVYGTVYTVRYYSYDAEQDSYFDNGTATVVAGDTLTLGEQFSYWYKCVGWATEEKGRMVYTVGQEITPTGDLKLYSVVEPFSAQVELGAEDAVYDRTVISGELPYSGVILTSFPTRPGYVFTGWLDEDGMFHEPFENEEGVRCIEIIFGKDTTLTAQWELCTHTPGEDGKCANCGMAVVTVKELPETVEAEIGEKAAVTVEATGKNLTYTWYFANPGKDTFSVTTAFTGPEYSVDMSESRNGRRIYCLVTDENGFFAKTNIVTLCLPRNELAIVTQPVDVTAAEGEKATVTFEATGDGLTYTWYYANPGKDTFSKTASFTSNTYEVTMSAARSGRRVYCVVTDKYGNAVQTDTVTLSMPMNVATIVSQSKSVWVPEGEKAVVTVEATGDGLTYKWYYKNPGATKYTYTDSFKGNTYSVTMTEARSGRYVYCKVTDKYGNTVKSKTVSVNMQTPLEIVTQPKSVKVAEGEKATVTVEAQGDGLTYKWYYKDPGGTKYKYTDSFKTNTYSITMSDARSGRYVFCRVYDKYGNMVKTNTVSLRMN